MARHRILFLAALLSVSFHTSSQAMNVVVDGFLILDNAAEDIDGAANAIEFDSTAAAPFGFTTLSGIDARGRVEITGVAGALAGQLNTGQSLVLTQFVADLPTTASPGQFNIVFEHTFGAPIPGGGTAADTIVAFAHDGSSSPPFGPGAPAVPLAAGEDTLDFWQGYVDNVPIPNPTTPVPPIANTAGLNAPYLQHSHATSAPLFGGQLFTPTLRGDLAFSLGGFRNQFILLSSAEVGLEDLGDPSTDLPIPMLPAAALLTLAAVLIAAARTRLPTRRTS